MRFIKVLVCLSAFFIPFSTCHGHDEAIQMYYTHFPPYTMRNEQSNQPQGILVDYVSHMLRAAKIDYNLKYYPPKRFTKKVNSGDAMIVTTFHDAINKDLYYVSESPVIQLTFSLYWRKGTRPINDISQLKNTSLTTMFGYSYDGFLAQFGESNNIEIRTITNTATALKMLNSKRIDYLLNYSATMNYYYSSTEMAQIENYAVGDVSLFLGIRKTIKNAQKKLIQLETAYTEAQANGIVNAAFERYTKH